MKRKLLMISLVVGMLMSIFGGSAGALDLTHYNKVRLWNDNDYDDLSRFESYDPGYNYELYPALHIQQSRPNSPYWVDRFSKDPASGANDAIPLLVEAGIDNTYASSNPLSSILLIRNHGYSANSVPTFSFNLQTGEWEVDQDVRWSELRFDNGACNLNDSGDCDGDTGYANAGVNTWGNDRILRLRPYKLIDNWQPASYVGRGEVRIKNFQGNMAARIVALSDNSASLEFVKGPDDKRFMEDSHSSVVTTSRIYRPASSDDLRISLNGIGDIVTLQGGTGNFGIGTSEPSTPFALNAGIGGTDVGITQGGRGGLHTMELTTADESNEQATRILLRGSNDFASVEFYRGPRNKEILSMIIKGDTGNVGIGTGDPTKKLYVAGNVYATGVVTWGSSRELKKDIRKLDADEAMVALNGLQPKKYYYKADDSEEHIGFIAEDVPELLATRDRKSLDPMDIVAVLTRVVQEQQKTIEELSWKVSALERGMRLKETLAMSRGLD